MGVALAVFAIGLAGGWFLKPLLVVNQETRSEAFSETAAERHAAPHGANPVSPSGEPANEFTSRLHDALSIRSRSKRERTLSAINDDFDAAQIREALARLDKMTISQREQVRAGLLARWGELDPEAAMEYALALSRTPEKRAAVNAVLNGWAEKDARAAARWIAELPEGVLKNAALGTLIKAVTKTDPPQALALLQGSLSLKARRMSRDSTDLVQAVFGHWAEKNLGEAATAAAQLDKPFCDTALSFVGERWARSDLAGALAWARAQPNDLAKRRLEASSSTTNAVTGVLETWINRDPEAAMTWLENLPEGNERANLIQCALLCTYQQDPAHAMELALMIPEGIAQESALGFAVGSWADTDPAGAFTWATGQPDEKVRRTTLKLVASRWLSADPNGASQWIASLPASPAKDGMVSDAARLILEGETLGRTRQNPSIDRMPGDGYRAIAQVVANISDPPSRDAALEKLAGLWLSKNSDAARAWIVESMLSPTVKERLLKTATTSQNNP